MVKSDAKQIAQDFLSFNDHSPSPFHAVDTIAKRLQDHDFVRISESSKWKLDKVGKYFFVREGSIVAFSIDLEDRSNAGFTIVGAHTDSPCFKVKPVSKLSNHGYIQVGVECYGGGLWHTWFDRDLTVAGRVIVKQNTQPETYRQCLVSIKRPILRIPNLAIHLSRNVATDGFKVNKQTDTIPILATELATTLNGSIPSTNGNDIDSDSVPGLAADRHPSLLLTILANELDVSPKDIVDLDLCLADTQPAAIGGALEEFVFAPRLDNLASCFTGTRSFLQASNERLGKNRIRMLICFDHEEIGSQSSRGADSPLLTETIQRICKSVGLEYETTIPQSLLISADMAHAIHPNYQSKHEVNHRPKLGGGLVIKTNQNQRYATSGLTGFVVREAARRAGNVPIQEFVVPNDKPCGSTIGPILSSRSGLQTVDVGQPQLAMHSIREMCAVADFELSEKVLQELMGNFGEILESVQDSSVSVDY